MLLSLPPYGELRDFLLLQLRKTNALLATENAKNTNVIILSVLICVLWFQKYYFHSCLFNITHYLHGCFAHCFPFHFRYIAYTGRSCAASDLRQGQVAGVLTPSIQFALILHIALGKLPGSIAYQVSCTFVKGVDLPYVGILTLIIALPG